MPGLIALPLIALIAGALVVGTLRLTASETRLRKAMRADPQVAFIVDTRALKASGLVDNAWKERT